ncbi:MAG: VWA domain-containing protein [Acidobacteria bacterium]|nr:VWA domain-containing protein [Acidobacteriota bacterium]
MNLRAVGVACACLALTGFAVLHAQPPTVFRSGVDLITVDVTVLDGNGTPIEGLTADQFEVKVDGASRRVLWSEFVPHRSRPLDPSGPSESFSSNEHVDPGRLVIIAVDQLHIRRVEGLAALRGASNFIDSLDARDLVAAAPLGDGRPIEFTSDHAAVKRSLQRLTGSGSLVPTHYNIGLSEALAIGDGNRSRLDMVVRRECGQSLGVFENPARLAENNWMRDPCPVQVEQEGRAIAQQARMEARLSLEALTRMIARLAALEGSKTLVLLSEGLVAEPQLFDLSALGAAAQAARVTIYVLHLDSPLLDASDSRISPTVNADRHLRADGLSRLAGTARGALFTLVGSNPSPFRRILREISGYYLVAFEAGDSDRDGRRRRIAVSTRAPGAMVRARPSFTIPATLTASSPVPLIERLLRSPGLSTELPLRVAAHTFQDADQEQLRVLVTAETDHAGYGREITVGYLVVNAAGVIVASGAATTESGRLTVPASLPPGRYLVRVAAVDAGGRQGSVERRFNAVLGGVGAVRLSDLMIADPLNGESPVLRPTAARAAGERVLLHVEAYAPPAWSPDGDVEFELIGPSSASALTATAAFRPSGVGRWTASVEVSLEAIAPGPYLAAARVPLGFGAPHPLSRTLVITRR